MNTYWEAAAVALKPNELAALELRDKHGLSWRAISLALDISVSTARSRVFSAHRKVAAQLKEPA